MKATGLLLLLTLVVTQARGESIFDFGEQDDANKKGQFDSWMTEEQKAEIAPLMKSPTELHDKIMDFYNELPADKKAKWDEYYRKECVSWIKKVASDDEIEELKELESKNEREELISKVNSFKTRLTAENLARIDLWKKECNSLLKESSRSRRDIDKNFEEFTAWMTDEQRETVSEMKASGKSYHEMRLKTMEFFEALPAEEQESLKQEFKGKCKVFFNKISTPEEMEKMKSLHDAGNVEELRTIAKEIIGRQSGDGKTIAAKMEILCTDVFAKGKRRRDIDAKISRRLSWMSSEQKEIVKQMYADGKPQADIRAKIFEFLSEIEGPAGLAAKEQTQKECYKWMDDVASAEEIASLHKMHETDHDGCKKKVREFIERLPVDKQEEVLKNLPFCEKVWYGDHDHSGHQGHHNHRRHLAARRRRHLHAIDKFLNWLTSEQKNELAEIEKSGSHFDDVIAKVKEFFGMLSEERKTELKASFKSQCSSWVKEVATPEELEDLKKMHEANDHVEMKKKLLELESRLSEEQKHTVEHVREICLSIWEIQGTRKRRVPHEDGVEEGLEKFGSWLSAEQKEKVKATYASGDRNAFIKQIMEYFESASDEVKPKASEELKAACKHYGKDLLGEENMEAIKELKDSGASHEAISRKVEEMVDSITDPEKKLKAGRLSSTCKKIYGAARARRDHHRHSLEEAMEKYLTWLSDDQMTTIKSLYEEGERAAVYEKVLEFFDAAAGETKEKAATELKGACKHYVKELIGEENGNVIREMKESGSSNDEIATKVEEMIEALADDKKKAQALRASTACRKIYGVDRRFRRDHHEHKFEEAMEKYLTWLSEDQKVEVKKIFEDEGRPAVYEKVMEMFEEATGEVKEKAVVELKAACRHYVKDSIGDENAEKIKEMKESGATNEEIAAKVNEFIAAITDEEKKAQAERAAGACKKIYGVARRFRRDHHEHKFEEAMEKYLTWLSEDQKAEVKKIFEEKGRPAVYEKVMEMFEEATGEVKEKAVVELKAACRHYVKDSIGDENAEKIKEMKESGATNEEIAAKVNEFIAAITDEKKKAQAERAAGACKKIYGVARRFRRDHHEHKFEEAMEKYLTWLSEDQKAEVKKIFEDKGRPAVYEKVMEMFEEATGEVKEKAVVELKAACRHYVKDSIGDENAEKIKEMKESGATNEEIAAKVNEFIAAITDEKKKAQAERAAGACKKIYGVARRFRRDHHEHKFEEAMEKYLTWLSEDQKAEVKKIFEDKGRPAVYEKVMEMFEEATGEVKEKAVVELKAACRHYVKDSIGDENAEKIKEMKESGATNEEIAAKVNEFIAAITDEEKKAQAERAAGACKKIYGVARRFRRDHHEHKFEEAMEKYLTWLSEDQKAEVKKIFEDKGRPAVYEKVMEMFEEATGEVKEKAVVELKAACRHYVKDSIGDENAEKIKEMKESGATNEEIAAKVNEFIAAITDEKKKAQAERAAGACKKIYGVARRFRRDHHEHKFEEAMEKYLTWLSEDQKAKVKKIFEDKGRPAVYEKVMEMFEEATGEVKEKAVVELKAACRHYVKDSIGDENAEKIKEMKESGATNEEIAAKVNEFIAAITDEKKKAQAEGAAGACKKIYGVARRFRRDHHEHTLEEAMEKYLTWLTDEQKAEVKEVYDTGDRPAVYKKILELFEGAGGEIKEKAATELKAACKHYVKDSIGDENAEKIKEMKDSGASKEEIASKVSEFIAAITDEKKKAQAERAAAACKKIYGVVQRFRRDHHEHTLEEALEKYLTWLDDEQKAEVKKIYETGDRPAVYKKVMEIFESAAGEVKEKAIVELKAACKHYLKDSIGDENAEKIKEMKDSGATKEAIAAKVNEFIAAITDEKKKAQAERAAGACKKIYGVARRMRREHHHEHSIEEAMEKYLSWLRDDQKAEVKKIYVTGDRAAVHHKVMEMFKDTSGDTKEKATAQLRAACKHYIKEYIGNDNVVKVKEMKDSGASNEAISAKIDEFIAAMTDEKKKEQAERVAKECKKVYGVKSDVSRARRHLAARRHRMRSDANFFDV